MAWGSAAKSASTEEEAASRAWLRSAFARALAAEAEVEEVETQEERKEEDAAEEVVVVEQEEEEEEEEVEVASDWSTNS